MTYKKILVFIGSSIYWGHTGDTFCASSMLRHVNGIVKEVETSHQPNSQGATDTDVQAEEGQAKEGAWELFEG